MNTIVMIAAATLGQFFDCPPPPICQPSIVCTAPADYVFLELDGMNERTRSYELIEYGEKKWRVPVINGYVPDVAWCKLNSGGYKIRYDYSSRTPLEECVVCNRAVPLRAKQKEYEPRSQPQPQRKTPAPVEEIRPEPRRALAKPRLEPEVEPERDPPRKNLNLKRPSEVIESEDNRVNPSYGKENLR